MAKIALNIVKVGMHSYFPNADLNLWLNFNFEKLVKRETSLCGFAKVGLKGGENILEFIKSLHARLLIKLASKFMIKFKFWETGWKGNNVVRFQQGGQNSLKRRESWRAHLSMQYASKHMIRFKF